MFLFLKIDQLMRESEQHRFENMRSLLDDKTRELITFQKQLRQQIVRLVSPFRRFPLFVFKIFNRKSQMKSIENTKKTPVQMYHEPLEERDAGVIRS